jgi:hypothetical protein
MPPITLAESDDLVDGILEATRRNETLLLEPGVHLTRPGRLQRIEIGASGLRMTATRPIVQLPGLRPPVVKRPDFSIDLGPPVGRADDNYGLSFVPAPPTRDEVSALTFELAADGSEFAVLVRGEIGIAGLMFDCNMGNQGLAALPKDAADHSAMLKFVGQRYRVGNRTVFCAFRSVRLTDITTMNGGFADDIWFSRGYFNPNIQEVSIERLRSVNRTDRRRSTIAFSGLCQSVVVRDADIYRLELEETSAVTYRDLPRRGRAFSRSSWRLDHVTAEIIDLAANGKVFTIRGNDLTTTTEFQLHQAAGLIVDSSLTMGDAHRLNQLDDFRFVDVTWTLATNEAGVVRGLRPNARRGDPCSVSFVDNVFTIAGDPISGQLLDSEHTADPTNRVTVVATGCTYPETFGRSTAFPIARAYERGYWRFAAADLEDRDPDVAIPRHPDPMVVVEIV